MIPTAAEVRKPEPAFFNGLLTALTLLAIIALS
jgi:hypothetical protein